MAAPLRHVAGNFGVAAQPPAGIAERRHHNVGPEARALLTEPPAFVFHPAFGLRHAQKLLGPVGFCVFGEKEIREAPAQAFLVRVAVNPARARVPTGNAACGVERDDCVVSNVLKNQAEALLAFPLDLLRAFANADVTPDRLDSDGPSVFVDQPRADLEGDQAAVPGRHFELIGDRPSLARLGFAHFLE